MIYRRKQMALLTMLTAISLTSPAYCDTYTITDLGVSLGTNSHASGINNQGQVVGYWQDAAGAHAFLYNSGSFSDLGSLGGTNHYALSINSAGQVVGFGESAEGVRGFFFSDGAMQSLGALGGLSSYAWGLNDLGQISGHVAFSNEVAGYIYDANGVTNLGTLGGNESYGFGVNNASLVVGAGLNQHQKMNAFLWNAGALTNLNDMLPALSGWELQEARGINNTGSIVGWGLFDGVEQAFLFKAGQVTGLGLLPECTNSFALGINSLDEVVGSGTRPDGVNQAFLWKDGSLINLNSLLSVDSGWDLQEARGINDAQQIVGFGLINGEEHAFLMSPKKSPTDASGSVNVTAKRVSKTSATAQLRKAPVAAKSLALAAMQTGMSLVGTNGRYAYFAFSDTNWLGERGQAPLAKTNALNVPSWAGNCLNVTTNSTECLKYRDLENDGSTNVNWCAGTIRFWLSPSWNSSNGPGRTARLIEVGASGNTNGWWALLINSNGTSMYLVTQTNGVTTTNVSTGIGFTSNQWYCVALTYATDSTAIYINGSQANSGTGITFVPSPTIRSNGFSIGSDWQGTNQANCRIDEMDTFDHPLASQDIAGDYQSVSTYDTDSDGLPDIQEFIIGTDPNNPDTDGDGLRDGFEVAWGLSPLVWNNPNADSDYDGRSDLQEQLDGTNPLDPNSVNTARLGYWRFGDTNWIGDQGQTPLFCTNLQSVITWVGNGARINTTNLARLTYRDVETNGSANINCRNGSVIIWFRPDWSSSTNGNGPQCMGRLIEMGVQGGTNDWWSLLVNSNGTQIQFQTQSNGIVMTNISAPISWTSNQWHQVVLAYSPNVSTIYIDGQNVADGGTGVTGYPRLSVRANGFSIGSDMSGANQAKGTFDELQTFNYPITATAVSMNYGGSYYLDSDADGLPNMMELQLGTDPNNPDSDGDGLLDGFEVQYGMNPLVWNNPYADSDYDGRCDIQEQADGTSPIDPSSVVSVRLGYWRFNDTNWFGEQGQIPLVATNLQNVPSWNSNALLLTSNAARLIYRDVETNGSANINCRNGSLRFWFKPNWLTGTTNGGPGYEAGLIEMGTRGESDWWALTVSSNGTQIHFCTRTNGVGMTNLAAVVDWSSNQWHQVVLTFSPNNSSFYLDGQAFEANGAGIAYYPRLSIRTSGFSVGSDTSGSNQARGTFEELETFNYPLSASDILDNYNQLMAIDTDGNGVSDILQDEGVMPPSTNGPPSLPVLTWFNFWGFDSTNWLSTMGYGPRSCTNLICTASWASNALWINSSNPAFLRYNVFETDGYQNVDVENGTLALWFKPDWTSVSSGGSGLGTAGRIIEVGKWTTNANYGCWSLHFDAPGNNIVFEAQNELGATVFFQSNISWASNVWHFIVLTYCRSNSTLYLDGSVAATGSGVVRWPNLTVQTNDGFSVGSDQAGLWQAKGQFENLRTYGYLWGGDTVQSEYSRVEAIINPQQQQQGLVNNGVNGMNGVPNGNGFSPMDSGVSGGSTNLQLQIGPGTNQTTVTLTLLGTQAGHPYRVFTLTAFTAVSNWQSGALITGLDSQTSWIDSNNGSNLFYLAAEAPLITTHPASQTVLAGTNLAFSITVTNVPVSYQWRFNGTNINGATNSTYSISNVQTNKAGTYSVLITNVANSLLSSNAVLVVNVPPSISQQPTNQTVVQGSNATFSVTASGTLPLSYQWQFNGNNIGGATSNVYTRTNVVLTNSGAYTVVVTNAGGSITSAPAWLTIIGAPSITNQPASQIVNLGANVTFTTGVAGTGPLTFQWRFNGTNIAGATTNTYSISNVQATNQGNYSLLVTNSAGSTVSSNASLTVNLPPSISTQPVNVITNQNCPATFAVIASGASPLSYQWRFNGGNISGATNSSYTMSSVTTNNAGGYSVFITNMAGTLLSSSATLTVNVAPVITAQPTNVIVVQGSNAVFSATVAGTSPLIYQWQFNSNNISWATNATLTVTNVQPTNAGYYMVIVTNAAGSATSANAQLTVNGPPTITAQPASLTNNAGSTAVFSVGCSGTQPLVYQWRKNGSVLASSDRVSGVATNQLQIIDIDATDAANYTVIISNVTTITVTSTVAVLTVNTNAQLARWRFETNTWPGMQGQVPLVTSTNLYCTTNGASNNAVVIDSTNLATLAYRDVEANNAANVSVRQGSVRFFFSPDWNTAFGPTNEARFVEMGNRDSTNGWWALVANTNGTLVSFITQTNGAGTTNLAAPINWQAGVWHQVVLTYCSTNSSFYVDGVPFITNGSGVAYWPLPSVRAQGFRIGSDSTGANQVRGIIDELETFNYPLLASAILTDYQNSPIADADADGVLNSKDSNNNNPQSLGDGLSDYFDWLHNITSAQGKPVLPLNVQMCPQ